MQGFDFDTVWAERRVFTIGEVEVPTARLRHVVESTLATGRDKDRSLATHKDALEQPRALGRSDQGRDASAVAHFQGVNKGRTFG